MANGTNSLLKLVGLVLLVLGVGLAYWGFQLSDSIQSELTEVVTGCRNRQSDAVLYRWRHQCCRWSFPDVKTLNLKRKWS